MAQKKSCPVRPASIKPGPVSAAILAGFNLTDKRSATGQP
ncbi:hypothetical protein SeGA_1492 [Salmonella enterica subsp. enterica serovar Gaminara str. A4-567]|nr:hypothetical protein SeGA_1492 [Salmonella enterica subsp. enterica serovar Gaminara str. A4-567]